LAERRGHRPQHLAGHTIQHRLRRRQVTTARWPRRTIRTQPLALVIINLTYLQAFGHQPSPGDRHRQQKCPAIPSAGQA
jgi:hypothetical protein